MKLNQTKIDYLNSLDKIEISSQEEWKKILDWGYKQFADGKEDYLISINEGTINYSNYIGSADFELIYFKELIFKNDLILEMIDKNNYSIEIIYHKGADEFTIKDLNEEDLPPLQLQNLKFGVSQLIMEFYSIMHYISRPATYEIIQSRRKKKPKFSRSYSKKTNTSNLNEIVIGKQVRKIYFNEDIEENDKREYNIKTKEFTRRGHWRRYRNKECEVIKKVWVKPAKIVRNVDIDSKDIKSNKTYKIKS